jgi:choline monooxygenase
MSASLLDLLSRFNAESPLDRAATIPADWYHSLSIADLERHCLFGDTWQALGRVDQVVRPGDYFTADLAGEPILVVRGEDGVLRGFFNVCRHRAARVACEEQGQVTKLRCRYHGWTYDLSGRLRGTPEFDGVCDFRREDNGLTEINVAVWGPLVWVHLGATADKSPLGKTRPSLATWTAPLDRRDFLRRMGALRFVARKEYRLECNWKVAIDNYLDGGYHVNTVHPALSGVLDYTKYRTEIDDHASVQISPLEKSDDSAINSVRTGDNAYYAWVFPNFMLNLYEDVMDTNLVLPLGPNACRVIFDYYFARPEESPSEQTLAREQQSIAVADQVQIEDVGICEEVQRGLASRSYSTGRFSVRREAGGYHFHQLLAKHLRASLGATSAVDTGGNP